MHVVFVTEIWPPQVNGVAFTVQALARGMAARGHLVELVRPDPGISGACMARVHARHAPAFNVPALQIGRPRSAAFRRQWQMRRPDAVYIAPEGPLGNAATRAANVLGIPVVTDFHTHLSDCDSHYGFRLLAPWIRSRLLDLHRRAQLTLAPTRAVAEELTAGGIPHVRKLHRGVDTGLFSPARRDGALRASWGASDIAPVLLCAGRVAAEKSIGLALQAYRALQARIPAARMVMVGDGPQRTAFASAYPDVLFAGVQHGEALATHYASADLFLFPSQTHTFGNVVMEAMASGLALVSFDLSAAQEHVANGISGIVVPPGDSRGFITASYELGMATATRMLLGTNARRVAERCTHERISADFERLLLALVSEHGHDPLDAAA